LTSLPINQILNGNCIEVLATLPEKSVDLIFADPPYNLQLQNDLLRPNHTLVDAVDDEWDKFSTFEEYDRFTEQWLTACRRVLKDTGTIWVIGSYHNIFRVGKTLMDLGYWILNDVLWYKTNPMPNFRGSRFTNATETMIWAKKSQQQKKYTFNYQTMKNLNDEKQMQNVWHIPVCRGDERIMIDGKKAHSTQKPEALLFRVILSSSNVGDVVLDPFFGSGTTGAVAKKLKRRFIGIEMNPQYVEVARRRIDSIPEPSADDTALTTKSRRDLARVDFGRLLEAGYLQPGQMLFSKTRDVRAIIKADGHLSADGLSGSIHRVAAQVQKVAAFNGWDYWYAETEQGEFVSIDDIRARYRSDNGY
jgi:DNA modification methylase